jgi:hypothetical protein
MLQPNQLWNYQSDRQVEAAAADEFVSANFEVDVRFWHFADIASTPANVRFEGNSGHPKLANLVCQQSLR